MPVSHSPCQFFFKISKPPYLIFFWGPFSIICSKYRKISDIHLQWLLILLTQIKNSFHRKLNFKPTRVAALVGAGDWKDVCMQETREEANKEAEGWINGADWEADTAKDQLEICREFGVCLWDERRSLSRAYNHEW